MPAAKKVKKNTPPRASDRRKARHQAKRAVGLAKDYAWMKLCQARRDERMTRWIGGYTPTVIKVMTKAEQKEQAAKRKAELARIKKEQEGHAEDKHDHDFAGADAGSALWFPMQASALRKNGHVMIKGCACKIVDMSTSKTGKHGHAKIKMTALDIFTGTKYETLSPSTHNLDVPNVKRTEWQVISIDDGFLTLLSADSNVQRSDIRLPEDAVGQEIEAKHAASEAFVVTLLSALGKDKVVAIKAQAQQ